MDTRLFLRDRFGGSLEVLLVESPDLYPEVSLLGSDAASVANQDPNRRAGRVREREDWLRQEVHRWRIDPDKVAVRVNIGSPAAEIAAEQERAGADLIVIGTHGRGTLGRALLGSVASAVLRTASYSLLVVGSPAQARP